MKTIFWFFLTLLSIAASKVIEKEVRQACECGTPQKATRIVGGTETVANEYPWTVVLLQVVQDKYYKFCGGTLISSKVVLTASHCLQEITAQNMVVNLGDHDLTSTTETANVLINVSSIIKHPNYDSETYDNDIALLILSIPVTFTANIRPICLPSGDMAIVGEEVTAAGWGATQEGGATSNKLLEVTVHVVSNEQCVAAYRGTQTVITQNMLCAGEPQGGKDSCQGDSGGPLIYKCTANNKYFLVGDVSYGNGCARVGIPGIYCRVGLYINWIQANSPSPPCISSCTSTGVTPTPAPTPAPGPACGIANTVSGRIVGGGTVQDNQFPWMAGIYVYTANNVWEYFSGASIISADWVLTSAKYVQGIAASNIKVVVGMADVYVIAPENVQTISTVIIHESYNKPSGTLSNDIAVLKFTTPVQFSKNVQPICLPQPAMFTTVLEDYWVSLLGWGKNATNGSYPRKLKEVLLYILKNQDCSAYYGASVVTSNIFCTYSSSEMDACERDTGGPLMMPGQKTGKYFQVGIQSFQSTVGCGSGNPSGNTRLSSYLSWIATKTGVTGASTGDVLTN